MKSISTPSVYFSPKTAESNAKQADKQPNLSPYLKAILSGATRLVGSANTTSGQNPDREAAIRYIKESALMRK